MGGIDEIVRYGYTKMQDTRNLKRKLKKHQKLLAVYKSKHTEKSLYDAAYCASEIRTLKARIDSRRENKKKNKKQFKKAN